MLPLNTPRFRSTLEAMKSQHILLCAADPAVRRWVDEELMALPVDVQVTDSVAQVLEVLTGSRRPWLIIDFAQVAPAEIDALQSVRSRSVAAFIALGRVPARVRSSLSLTHTIARPFGSEALRAIVDDKYNGRETIRMRKIDR